MLSSTYGCNCGTVEFTVRKMVMKLRKPKKKPNPIARALNLVTKPVTMVDKKKLMSKMKCRQKLNLNEGE